MACVPSQTKTKTNHNGLIGKTSVMISQKNLFLKDTQLAQHFPENKKPTSYYIPVYITIISNICLSTIISGYLEGFCELQMMLISSSVSTFYLSSLYNHVPPPCIRLPCLNRFQEVPVLRYKQYRGSLIFSYMQVGEISMQQSQRSSAKIESVSNKGTV